MVIAGQLPLTFRATKLRLGGVRNPHPNLAGLKQKLDIVHPPRFLKSKHFLLKLAVLHRRSPLPKILTDPTENPDVTKKGLRLLGAHG
jgi:hypothetical protein